MRNVKGFTFSGGTSAGKVVNDWCAIRNALPENAGAAFGAGYLLNPYSRNRSLDLSLRKIIHRGKRRLTAGLDVYNVANADTDAVLQHDVRAAF